MISVVLYGRNDAYGYNLHKRAVLSVNCIAEVLDDPDDEIIFVDYNTPDDLPTFPEAIGDMLSERARKLTRVLRVREAHHARFADKTHLKALESPSRNTAVRRSNPRNRWVLSTNTDMVFVTRTGSSLSSVVANLPDGFYHTARFELPEVLWETLDRKDPAKCIASIARWGERLQLQEVVYGSPITLFDGPGDFQLALREDLFRIDGFDERMLLGWHVDTNIARRLEILRGEPVKSALDQVLAFHCDHNRETTPAHSHSAPQNDWGRFVTEVTTAGIPEQHHSWGLAGDTLEDFHLGGLPSAPSILERLLPPMPQPFYITSIEPQFFQDLRYDPEHVVPYVANVIGALPRDWNVAYAGCRRKMFTAFRSLWEALGFQGKILVTDQISERVLALSSDAVVEVAPESEVHARSDIFVFEVGSSRDDDLPAPSGTRNAPADGMRMLSPEEYQAFQLLHRAYVRAVDAERRAGRAARRFVLINMQTNPSESLVQSHVGASWTPIATHVRHGFVLPDPFAAPSIDPAAWLSSNLNGKWRPQRELLADIARKVAGGADATALTAYENVFSDLIWAFGQRGASEALRVAPDKLAKLIDDMRARRPSEKFRRAGIPMTEVASPSRGLSRIMAIEDFDDPDWGRCAVRAVGVRPIYEIGVRSRFAWAGAHLVYTLERCGALDKTAMLLQHPADDPKMTQLLSSTVIDWSSASAIYDSSQGFAGEPVFDAVIVSPKSALLAGAQHVPAVLTAVDQALKPGGVCILVLDVVVGAPRNDAIDLRSLQSEQLTSLLEREVNWRMAGPLEAILSARTLDAAVFDGRDDAFAAVRVIDSDVYSLAILVYQKTATSAADAWKRYYAGVPRRASCGDRTVMNPRSSRRLQVHWFGPFYTNSSIAVVNRRLVGALIARGNVDVAIRSDPLPPQSLPPEFRIFAQTTMHGKEADAVVVHEYPPRFAAPRHARYVHVQPWEFGSMPREWFDALHDDCDDVWTHSTFNRDVYVADGIDASRVAVIPHGVDRDVFNPDGPKMQISPAGFRFLFVGGTIKRKGIDVLLNAYVRAFSRPQDVVLTIKDAHTETLYRGQTLREEILALSARSDVARIEYTDAVFPEAAMAQLMRAADCLVLPYRGEGFALPVLEAMACAKPVIVTAGGATDDFVDDEVGWRISSTRTPLPHGTPAETVREAWALEPDIDRLAAAMREAYENRAVTRSRGQTAAARASLWTWERAAEIAEQRLRAIAERIAVTPKRRAQRYEDPATYEERIFGSGKLDGVLLELFRRIGVRCGTFAEATDGSFAVGPVLERGMAWRRATPQEAGAELDLLSVASAAMLGERRPPVLALRDEVDARALRDYTVVARDGESGGILLVRNDLADRCGFRPLPSPLAF